MNARFTCFFVNAIRAVIGFDTIVNGRATKGSFIIYRMGGAPNYGGGCGAKNFRRVAKGVRTILDLVNFFQCS